MIANLNLINSYIKKLSEETKNSEYVIECLREFTEGEQSFAKYAAVLYLIKEGSDINSNELTKEEIEKNFTPYLEFVKKHLHLIEEVPVNSAGSGAIAGIGVGPKKKAEPGFSPRQMRKYKNKNNILKRKRPGG